MIKRKSGGVIELKHGWKREGKKKVNIDIKLEVGKNSISKDADFILSIDEQRFLGSLDVVFEPHGVFFQKPALLSISAKGLDLSLFDESSFGIYYENEETGFWEAMKYKELKVNIKKGEILLKKAELPHFSRYAIASE